MVYTILLAFLHVTRVIPVLIGALVGFVVGPRVKLGRVTGACLAALLLVVFDDLYFAQAGGSPWRWALLLPAAAVWLGPWVVTPFRVRKTVFPYVDGRVEPWNPERHRTPEPSAAWLRMTMDELVAEGFTVMGDVAARLRGPGVAARLVVMDHVSEPTRAVLSSGLKIGAAVENDLAFVTVLADGREVAVINSLIPRAEPRPPRIVGAQLPGVRDARTLLRVFRAFAAKHAGGQARSLPPGDDAIAYLTQASRRKIQELTESGWYRAAGEGYRQSLRAAALTTWSTLFPLRQMRAAQLWRRQTALLRELGFDVRQPAETGNVVTRWLAYGGLQAIAAVALLALGLAWPWLAERGGYAAVIPLFAAAPKDSVVPERLPAGFTVPGDFRGAVAALERLAGTRARPFTADDGYSGQATDGVEVDVAEDRVKALLAGAQPAFRERGFYLFQAEEYKHFDHTPHTLALFPVRDPFAVLLRLNTNGGNYGIDPEQVVAFLREVDRQHPITITSAGFDYVEARFREPLTAGEARTLAARVARFCPDVVSQGTGSVHALAAEIRRERTLYCWWD
jgi:hypothetical protein